MEKILFILNPIAGRGRAETLIPLIEKTMKEQDIEFKIEVSEKPKQAIRIAEENLDKYKILVAVGGDGTVNEVAKGIINKGKGTLGILPSGTGNDMAKSLGISEDPEAALESIIQGKTRQIDVGRVNSYNFLNIASVGFDAEVVQNNIRIKKKIKNGMSYAVSVVYTLLHFKKRRVSIQIDDQTVNEKLLLLAVGNGKYYGGGMKILPAAQVDDGYLHICTVSNISTLTSLFLFPSIFKGNHIKYKKYVKSYRGKKVSIKTGDHILLNIDGDIVDAKEANFSLEDKKISVIAG